MIAWFICCQSLVISRSSIAETLPQIKVIIYSSYSFLSHWPIWWYVLHGFQKLAVILYRAATEGSYIDARKVEEILGVPPEETEAPDAQEETEEPVTPPVTGNCLFVFYFPFLLFVLFFFFAPKLMTFILYFSHRFVRDRKSSCTGQMAMHLWQQAKMRSPVHPILWNHTKYNYLLFHREHLLCK